MSGTVRRRVIYHGRVQGVGFRATVHGYAARHPIAGYVRNLPDGTVELLADGPLADVETLLVEIGDRFSRHIDRADVDQIPADAPLTGFTIR